MYEAEESSRIVRIQGNDRDIDITGRKPYQIRKTGGIISQFGDGENLDQRRGILKKNSIDTDSMILDHPSSNRLVESRRDSLGSIQKPNIDIGDC